MKDRSALLMAIVIAGVIFALQLFVKQNVFSSANIEAAGKLHKIFKAGDILPLLKSSSSQNTVRSTYRPCKKISISSAMILQHKEFSECPFASMHTAEHNKAIVTKYRLRAKKS